MSHRLLHVDLPCSEYMCPNGCDSGPGMPFATFPPSKQAAEASECFA